VQVHIQQNFSGITVSNQTRKNFDLLLDWEEYSNSFSQMHSSRDIYLVDWQPELPRET